MASIYFILITAAPIRALITNKKFPFLHFRIRSISTPDLKNTLWTFQIDLDCIFFFHISDSCLGTLETYVTESELKMNLLDLECFKLRPNKTYSALPTSHQT